MNANGATDVLTDPSLASIRNLTEISEIQGAFVQAQQEEEEQGGYVSELFKGLESLDEKTEALNKILPTLDLLNGDSDHLCGIIDFTDSLADSISSKVRLLDLAKSQVFAAIQRVDDILDLKFCTDGVKQAMEANDYEKAAANIYRYLCLDENVIKQTIHDPTESSSINASLNVLKNARIEMSQVVSKQFDEAVKEENLTSVERFFKIFPLLKMEDEGLKKFSDYLCREISKSSSENLKQALNMDPSSNRYNVMFADVITLLYEGIARTVEKQQPLVETYYGPGKLFLLIKQIQLQCDKETERVLDKFKQVREFKEMAQKIQQSLFGKKSEDVVKVDPRSLEALLTEVTVMSSRTELYLRFIRRRLQSDIETVYSSADVIEEKKEEMKMWLKNCGVNHLVQEIIGYYIIMEEYYMRESTAKAILMDSFESGSFTSSMTDDVFFILKQCIKRSMSSDSIDCVCAMLNHATGVLDTNFKDVLIGHIKAGFPSGGMLDNISSAYNVVQSSFQQGKLHSVDEQNNITRQHFLCTLNNCEVASEHVQTLKKSLDAEVTKVFSQLSEQGEAKLESCLQDLVSLSYKFQNVLQSGLKELKSGVLKPEVKPWIGNFLSITHNISEENLADYEADDPWVQQLTCNLQTLINKFQMSLSTNIFDQLVSCLIDEIVVQLEKAVFKSTFNRLGSLFFDKELRSLVNYLTSITSWTVRDKFSRLMQMSTALNLEQVNEIEDYWGQQSGSLTWRLTPAEVRQVLNLRIDFKSDDIRRLKL